MTKEPTYVAQWYHLCEWTFLNWTTRTTSYHPQGNGRLNVYGTLSLEEIQNGYPKSLFAYWTTLHESSYWIIPFSCQIWLLTPSSRYHVGKSSLEWWREQRSSKLVEETSRFLKCLWWHDKDWVMPITRTSEVWQEKKCWKQLFCRRWVFYVPAIKRVGRSQLRTPISLAWPIHYPKKNWQWVQE